MLCVQSWLLLPKVGRWGAQWCCRSEAPGDRNKWREAVRTEDNMGAVGHLRMHSGWGDTLGMLSVWSLDSQCWGACMCVCVCQACPALLAASPQGNFLVQQRQQQEKRKNSQLLEPLGFQDPRAYSDCSVNWKKNYTHFLKHIIKMTQKDAQCN